MEYESDDMPVIFFYEVDLINERFMIREIEVFADNTVKLIDNPYYEVIEMCPIPTVEELNENIWGEGFYAINISKEEFYRIWDTKIYNGSLKA